MRKGNRRRARTKSSFKLYGRPKRTNSVEKLIEVGIVWAENAAILSKYFTPHNF